MEQHVTTQSSFLRHGRSHCAKLRQLQADTVAYYRVAWPRHWAAPVFHTRTELLSRLSADVRDLHQVIVLMRGQGGPLAPGERTEGVTIVRIERASIPAGLLARLERRLDGQWTTQQLAAMPARDPLRFSRVDWRN
jgi:hypothetical protein